MFDVRIIPPLLIADGRLPIADSLPLFVRLIHTAPILFPAHTRGLACLNQPFTLRQAHARRPQRPARTKQSALPAALHAVGVFFPIADCRLHIAAHRIFAYCRLPIATHPIRAIRLIRG
jgi:hypothetical protein